MGKSSFPVRIEFDSEYRRISNNETLCLDDRERPHPAGDVNQAAIDVDDFSQK